MFEAFDYPFMQRALVEVLLLSVAAGTLGTWIVVRGLAFYSHGVAAAAFPRAGARRRPRLQRDARRLGVALLFALTVGQLAARTSSGHDALTALVLVAALAVGVVLASDVFESGANVETLLFGSLLAIGPDDVRLAALVAVLALLATAAARPALARRRLRPAAARALGVRSPLADLVLLGLIALAAVATLSAVGALLATALLVVPAATTRLLTRRLLPWQAATVVLAAVEGRVGLWLSFETNAPPGATIAVISGGLFALVAAGRAAAAALAHARARKVAVA